MLAITRCGGSQSADGSDIPRGDRDTAAPAAAEANPTKALRYRSPQVQWRPRLRYLLLPGSEIACNERIRELSQAVY
jgi:hypothetical protein